MRFKVRKLKSIIVMLLLVLILFPALSCSNAETEPIPPKPESRAEESFKIGVSTPVKDTAGILTVIVSATTNVYRGSSPQEVVNGKISVSFPGISNVANIKQYTTDMDKGIKLIPPGEYLSTRYGEGIMVKTTYPVLEAREEVWDSRVFNNPETKQVTFKVLPEKKGTFTFYVKAQGTVRVENTPDVLVYSPVAGAKDEHFEYVFVYALD
jgi:hypothetical protein